MRHAKNFDGEHEVVHWSGQLSGGIRPFFEGWLKAREVEDGRKFDLIICQAFGAAFGVQKGGSFVKVRHFFKAVFERVVMGMVFSLKKKHGVPLAVVDVTDDISIHPLNASVLKECDLYFKRELPLDPFHAFESFRGSWFRSSCLADRKLARWAAFVEKLRPMSLGCASVEPDPAEYSVPRERQYDIFYAVDETFRPRREGLQKLVDSLKEQGVSVYTPPSRLGVEDYLEKLSLAHATISPPGLGWDCHRLYEAALMGTISFTTAPIIQRANPFINGSSCFFYDEEGNVVQQIVDSLADKSKLQAMSKEAQRLAKECHTHRAIFSEITEKTVRIHRLGDN